MGSRPSIMGFNGAQTRLLRACQPRHLQWSRSVHQLTICSLNLTSDGQGSHHGWYCDYVEVTSTGPHKECGQTIFYVDQWLAADAPPFKLTALLDGCRIGDDDVKKGKHGKFVVENVRGFDFA
ncbi:PLAT domain-containing protein [Salix suchowensis]|nr:PLAT domain-containing protein [Salix suchowensis]